MNTSMRQQDIALKVMIIDDDEFQIEFVSELLSELGIDQIISASGGQSGLNIFDKTQKKPDLLICDIQMPDIDGFEFMRALGERNFQGGVILMSGQGAKVLYTASLVAQLSRQNFLGTIEKPMQKIDLEKAIAQLLNP